MVLQIGLGRNPRPSLLTRRPSSPSIKQRPRNINPFIHSTNDWRVFSAPETEYSEVRRESQKKQQKPWLKGSGPGALVGESPQRCHDRSPKAHSSLLAVGASRAAGVLRSLRWAGVKCPEGVITQRLSRPRRPRGDPGREVTQPLRALPELRRRLCRRKQLRALTSVGPPPPPPCLGPVLLAWPDPVWPPRAQRPRGRGCR